MNEVIPQFGEMLPLPLELTSDSTVRELMDALGVVISANKIHFSRFEQRNLNVRNTLLGSDDSGRKISVVSNGSATSFQIEKRHNDAPLHSVKINAYHNGDYNLQGQMVVAEYHPGRKQERAYTLGNAVLCGMQDDFEWQEFILGLEAIESQIRQ